MFSPEEPDSEFAQDHLVEFLETLVCDYLVLLILVLE
jgi:hypothetical protein